MTHEVEAKKVSAMFSSIAERYDVTNTVLSMGIHWLWKRRITSMVNEGARVLDLCTGTGDLLPLLSRRASEVIGADFCLPMLEQARRRGFVKENVSLVQADALAMPFESGSFNVVTIAFGVRNFEDTEAGLRESLRVLSPGGKLLVLEFGQPNLPVWKQFYVWYSRSIMPIIGGMLTGNREAYEYLPSTAAAFPCREAFTHMLERCGFCRATYTTLSGGIAYIYEAVKP